MTDWSAVVALIGEKTGHYPARFEAKPLPGGDINRAWRLDDGSCGYFVKTNHPNRLAMFEAELAGLDEIGRSCSIRVPRPIGCGVDAEQSFIVMEFVELGGSAAPGQLAEKLAAMHSCQRERYGFEIDNTIGSTRQVNSASAHWVDFWRQHRLGFQLDLARQNRLDSTVIDRGERLNAVVDRFFTGYLPAASLLHGDLWSGNYAADSAGNPVVFDPACYYGDHEADLAMMELFGNPGQDFFAAYHDRFAIDDGYALRRDLYNLYHLLNHANLFGGGYAASAGRVIERLLAAV